MGTLLLPSINWAAGADEIKIEYPNGFDTAGQAEHFRAYWKSLQDQHKMKGNVSNYLTKGQIDSVVMLEVNIAIALDRKNTGLRNELLGFLTEGNRFEMGRLPDRFDNDRPRKELVALFRTKKGDYGLITCYSRQFTVVELNGLVGVVPAKSAASSGRGDEPKQQADNNEDDIKAEVRGTLHFEHGRGYFIAVKPANKKEREMRVWLRISEDKLLVRKLQGLDGKKVIAKGKLAQLPKPLGHETSVPPLGMYLSQFGGLEIRGVGARSELSAPDAEEEEARRKLKEIDNNKDRKNRLDAEAELYQRYKKSVKFRRAIRKLATKSDPPLPKFQRFLASILVAGIGHPSCLGPNDLKDWSLGNYIGLQNRLRPYYAPDERHLAVQDSIRDLRVTVEPLPSGGQTLQEILWRILEKYDLTFELRDGKEFYIRKEKPKGKN